MKNNSGTWLFIGVAVLVVIVCVPIGYYFFAPSQTPAAPPSAPSASADATSAPAQDDTPVKTAASSSEYTAPDAPAIQITEVKPKATTKPAPITSATDSEASQTGAGDNPNAPTGPGGLIPTPATSDAGAPTPEAPANPVTQPGDQPSPAPAGSNTQPPTPPAPQPSPAIAPSATTAPPDSTDNGGGDNTVYHVLVGKPFADEGNARIFASSLRHRGYMAVTEAINSGDGALYKVQVGAYKNRQSAEDEVNLLQQSGYPAYIATDR